MEAFSIAAPLATAVQGRALIVLHLRSWRSLDALSPFAGVLHPAAVAVLVRRCFGRKIWSLTSAPVVITGRGSRR